MKATQKDERDDPPKDLLVFGSMGSGKKSSFAKCVFRQGFGAPPRFDWIAYQKEREDYANSQSVRKRR